MEKFMVRVFVQNVRNKDGMVNNIHRERPERRTDRYLIEDE